MTDQREIELHVLRDRLRRLERERKQLKASLREFANDDHTIFFTTNVDELPESFSDGCTCGSVFIAAWPHTAANCWSALCSEGHMVARFGGARHHEYWGSDELREMQVARRRVHDALGALRSEPSGCAIRGSEAFAAFERLAGQ